LRFCSVDTLIGLSSFCAEVDWKQPAGQ
jgi:hypothetical protein